MSYMNKFKQYDKYLIKIYNTISSFLSNDKDLPY